MNALHCSKLNAAKYVRILTAVSALALGIGVAVPAAANFAVSPSSFDFGAVTIGSSVTEVFTITTGLTTADTFISLTATTTSATGKPELSVDLVAPDCSQNISSCTADV